MKIENSKKLLIFLLVFFGVLGSWSISIIKLSMPVQAAEEAGWQELLNTKIRSVAPVPSPGGSVSNVINAWSGGAFDTKRNKLIILGGGHGDYAGNELYAIDVVTSTVQRIFGPDPAPAGWPSNSCVGANAQGNPVSRHTYGMLAYIEHADKLFAFGGSQACGSGGFGLDTWTYDFSTGRWQDMQPSFPAGTTASSFFSANDAILSAAYDPVTRKIFARGTDHFYTYDYNTNTWSWLKKWESVSGAATAYAAIDSVRRKYVWIGSFGVKTIDLDGPDYAAKTLSTTNSPGCAALCRSPGVAYDPVRDRIVVWAGADNDVTPDTIYSLNLDTGQWTATTVSGGPGKNSISHGTFGRWRYIPSMDVFVIVNSVDQNAYIYKFSSGGTPPDTVAPTVSVTAPLSGSTVSGSSVAVSASASDNAAVAGVQFKLDGANLGSEDTIFPYSITWDSTQTANGFHTLTATARDAAGNQATSLGIAVTVNNVADTQSPTTPTNLVATAISSSQINLAWTASTDNVGVVDYRIYRNGAQISTSPTNSYSNTGLFPSTTYSYTVSAYDAAGNEGTKSSSVSGTTLPDTTFSLSPVTIQGVRFYSSGKPYFPSTHFLMLPISSHVYLSSAITNAQKQQIINDLKSNGYNSIYLYTLNENDYGAQKISPYASGVIGGNFDDTKIQQWRSDLINLINTHQLRPIIWLFPDDAPTIHSASVTELKRYIQKMVTSFDDLPVMWVLGLEVDEYWSKTKSDDLGSYLKSIAQNPVGIHQLGGATSFMTSPWVDFGVYQYGFSGTWSDVYNDALQKKGSIASKPFIFAEYHVDQTTQAKQEGLAASFAGVSGVGNGAPANLDEFMQDLPNGMVPSRSGNILYLTGQGITATADVNNLNFYSSSQDATSPTQPTNLIATAVSSSQINLAWTASTDNVGVTGYRVERCQGLTCTNFAQIATPTGTSYSDAGLSADTTYRYRIRATDAAGNLSGYSSIVNTTTQDTSITLNIPVNTWVARAIPSDGSAACKGGGCKHIRFTHNPVDGKIYVLGGDHSGSSEGFPQSGRNEMYTYDILSNTWQLIQSYCRTDGLPYPTGPDEIGWVYDTKRNIFWMIPGYQWDNTAKCSGTNQIRGQIMTYDPVASKWTEPGRTEATRFIGETWAQYDPVTDTIIVFYFDGGRGPSVAIYDIASDAWSYVSFSGNARWNDVWTAIDPSARAIYLVTADEAQLYRYHIDNKTIQVIAQTPVPSYAENMPIWDPVNRVLHWIWFNDSDTSTGAPQERIHHHVYHPDTNTWEVDLPINQPDGLTIKARHAVFDPINNVLMVMGNVWNKPNTPYLFFYRYSNGSSSSLKGDVNLDGSVDILDVQALVNHILGTQDHGTSADVNTDGSVNVLDVQEVVNIILGG